MNACVESVCPTPMMPEALDAPVREDLKRIPARETAWAWLRRGWMSLAEGWGEAVPGVVHVHVESFYAAVEQAENPRLRGNAVVVVVVGGGAVASASPEAAGRGVAAGMTIRDAVKTCPNAIVVPGDYARYAEVAARVRRILEGYASSVEMTACGSFYMDFLGTTLPYSTFEAILRQMQAEILGQTGLSASVGAAGSRMVAALAAREHQPCGLRVVALGKEREFLGPLPIQKLRGIGSKHLSALAQGGVRTIRDLQKIPKPALVAAFGAAVGIRMWNLARGQDVNESSP